MKLADAVRDLVAWAKFRIDECRRVEERYMTERVSHPTPSTVTVAPPRDIPQAVVEAWSERRALLAVLAQLGVEYPPPRKP